ncbi:hypothetical protein B0G81_6777 [Paraburkholderia sp. BL6665CI2N2]|uniref:hypothetical protein n=1 Tax=Paraburkholderia sp. BL6665CI2N2 TaxID=1938806 RepID=UPI001065193B|nr:hypothetical protein [Paraburkholderia sp. BL6665CI2N2]TDY26267.1 hypothetical protein B0G81_6777 [Paraburkholderia sp. BL6665CI2N2]
MRAAIPITDDMLAREFKAQGCVGTPDKVHPAVRAALLAAVRAQIDPNPRARAATAQRIPAARRPLPEPRNAGVDAKRLAANDLD